jgi:hypothetical protein
MAFDPNSFDSFRLASSAGEFINIIMSDAELVTLCGTVYPLIDALGEVRPGYHYAPFVSPMFGGSMSPDNWSVAPVRAHLATCVAEFDAVAGLVGN